MSEADGGYYVPHGTHWPILGSIGLTLLVSGFASYLNGSGLGMTVMMVGLGVTLFMVFGLLVTSCSGSSPRAVVEPYENALLSVAKTYNEQVDKSFRWGMSWFIFSEVMFFAAFFGALFYARVFSVPWIGGADLSTNELLWNGWEAMWPTNGPANLGGDFSILDPWKIPALNTLLLLSSGVTITSHVFRG